MSGSLEETLNEFYASCGRTFKELCGKFENIFDKLSIYYNFWELGNYANFGEFFRESEILLFLRFKKNPQNLKNY